VSEKEKADLFAKEGSSTLKKLVKKSMPAKHLIKLE
jgi:hypothetical protein